MSVWHLMPIAFKRTPACEATFCPDVDITEVILSSVLAAPGGAETTQDVLDKNVHCRTSRGAGRSCGTVL
jgi:hypothetical protein